jgi:hypothetical protein
MATAGHLWNPLAIYGSRQRGGATTTLLILSSLVYLCIAS